MRAKRNKGTALLVLLTLTVTLLFLAASKFMYSVIEAKSFSAMMNNTMEMMSVMRDVTVENVQFRIRQEKASVASCARQYGSRLLGSAGREASITLGRIPLPAYGIDYIFRRADGGAVSARGSNPAYFAKGAEGAWAGETVLDGPAFRENGAYVMAVSAPVFQGGKAEGVLTVLLDGFCLSEWISDIQFPSGGGLAYIIDQNGTNIAVSTQENRDWVTTEYNAQALAENDPESKTVANLEIQPLQGNTGLGSYLWEGSRNYLSFAPVPETGWGLFVGVYGEILHQYARGIISGGVTANQFYLVIFVLILCVLSILEVRWLGREQRDNKELTEQKEALIALQKKTEEQAALLMEHHQTILESLEYAKKIQRNLLPDKRSCKGRLSEFDLIWSPKDAVGGDLYWMKHFSGGTLLCVCDCTGHGVPGAMLTMLVATALDAIVDESNYRDPAEIMWQLERKLVSVLNAQKESGGKQNRISDISDGADLALLSVGKDNEVVFSSGNTHVFVCNGADVTDFKGQRLHIGTGALASKEQIKSVSIPADQRNRFYVASDGYFDQIGGEKRLPFGYRPLKQMILERHAAPMDAVIQALWTAFEAHRGTEPRRDDVELLGFRA